MQGIRKRIALTGAIAAIALALVGLTVAAQPQQAQAFAWKDTCKIIVVNRAAQSAVRPIGLVQVPPNVVAYATYTALIATGFPQNGSVSFATTGIPLTGGCSALLYLNNPGTNVNCKAIAPTVGANTFRCDGNSTFKIETDNDDIVGTVEVAKGSLATEPEPGEATPPMATPPPPSGALKKSQLSGKGWKKTTKVEDLGTFGKLFEASDPSASCDDGTDSAALPISGGSSLFVRGQGKEAIGEFDGTYASLGKSKQSLALATSKASVKCLAQALSAPGYTAKVAARGPDFGQGGISTNRVIVKKNGGGFVGYVDLVGLQLQKSNTVLAFFNAGKPAPVGHEEDVLEAVADSLQG